jgi:hypothetical protein
MSFRRIIGILVALIVVAILALVLVLVLSNNDDTGKTTNPAPTTTNHVTTSTHSAATTTTTAPTTPEGYAQAMYAVWKANDRAAAGRVGSPDAVNQMFAVAYQPVPSASGPVDPYTAKGCGAAAGSIYCTWTTGTGAQIVIQVRNLTGGLPILVTGVQRQ